MDDNELKTLKELIDNFDAGYYEKENDKLQKEISNIRSVNPRYEGIHDLIHSEIVPQNQREKEIKRLQNEIKDNNEKRKELGQALAQLRRASDKLESLAKQDLLLDTFYSALGKNAARRNVDIYKKNESKYQKLYLLSTKPISHSKNKISKEMYKIIKKHLLERVHERHSELGLDYLGHYYESMATSFEENKINLDKKSYPGHEIFKDFKKEYMRPFADLSHLGVDVSALDSAKDQMYEKLDSYSLTWQGQIAFNKLKDIEKAKEAHVDVKYSKLIKLKEKYTEIEELSRETWYLEEVLKAFKDTAINETEMYQGLNELVREQELQLSKLIREADKEYEKLGLQKKIDLIEQLEELYRKAEELNSKIEQYKNMGNEKYEDLLEGYHDVRYEMIKILKDNPDLNKPKYNINTKKIKEKEKVLFESEIKKEESSYIKPDKEEIFVEETGKVESLELDSNLQTNRTYHYQNYMREKVLGRDLGKLSFSLYLESVAPHLAKLISIEKERESLARTIYKAYLLYYSSLDNKKNAISFYDFAKANYQMENVDIPVEYEEEYKGMIK